VVDGAGGSSGGGERGGGGEREKERERYIGLPEQEGITPSAAASSSFGAPPDQHRRFIVQRGHEHTRRGN